MDNSDFAKWPKINQLYDCKMVITQKMNGTNGQIVVTEDGEIKVGSRTRYLSQEVDNFNFWSWCMDRKAEIVSYLGVGRHYGEYCGPGIQSGEGLLERQFVLFHGRVGYPLPNGFVDVPVLYKGPVSSEQIAQSAELLKTHGSYLVPGFMRPEGVVVQIGSSRWKYVFEPEDTQWDLRDLEYQAEKNRERNAVYSELEPLLQPVRLDHILSHDSTLLETYPKSIKTLIERYISDISTEIPADKLKPLEGRLKLFTTMVAKMIKSVVPEKYSAFFQKC